MRNARTLSLCGAIIGVVGLLSPVAAVASPRISSFYVKDEGATIQLKVNYCDYDADVTDSFSSTFRIWDENGGGSAKVFERRVSGRIYGSCGYAYFKIPDDFANGLYSANAAVTNRTQGSFSRLGARYFVIR